MFTALVEDRPRPWDSNGKGIVMKIKLLSDIAVVALAVAGGTLAAGNPIVGGAPM